MAISSQRLRRRSQMVQRLAALKQTGPQNSKNVADAFEMKLTAQQIKQRYFDRIYNEAPEIPCACGCGTIIKSKDRYGRDKQYVNGHNNRKYDDPRQYKREWNHRNRTKRKKYKKIRTHSIKGQLITEAGGKCLLCGLDFDGECTAIFDFHHRDASEKLFNLNNNSVNRYSLLVIREEAAKCDLLCANCHRLVHWDWDAVNTADSREELLIPETGMKV